MDGVGRIARGSEEQVFDGRDRKRDSVFVTAQLRFAGAAALHEVRVRNLSEGGLMMEFDRAIDVGQAVTLEIRGLGEVTGTVAWATRNRVGVALDQPIDPKRARKPVGGGAATPIYASPAVLTRTPRR